MQTSPEMASERMEDVKDVGQKIAQKVKVASLGC
jgi:hypothetical protein